MSHIKKSKPMPYARGDQHSLQPMSFPPEVIVCYNDRRMDAAVEMWIRLGFFVGGLVVFWGLGRLFHFRSLTPLDRKRVINNIALTLLNSLLVRLFLPSTLVVLAHSLQEQKWGLFNWAELPVVMNVFFSFILLDGLIYFQHVIFHRIPLLWRLHQVHHSDVGFDTTTALRFHPIEILLSIAVKASAIALIGIDPLGVVIFEVLLNFSAMFNHGNFSLPAPMEKVVRRILVTPDMHRIHHSVLIKETNSNYGFFLSIWDRLFKSYTHQSQNDLRVSDIGVERFRSAKDQRLDQLLLQPFRNS